MTDRVAAALEVLGDRVAFADREAVRTMLRYFDRSSLYLARVEGAGETLVLRLANEAEAFSLPIAQLRACYEGLRAGRAVDWSKLDRLR